MGNIRDDVRAALLKSWDKDTAYPGCRDLWSGARPEFGQCAVTALVIQDYFGGIILGSPRNHHYFNLIDGAVVDYTVGQFDGPIDTSDATEKSRRSLLYGPSAERAETLSRYARLLFAFSRMYQEARP